MEMKEVIEFIIGQKGNKHITVMEKIKYNEIIKILREGERYKKIFKLMAELLFDNM